MYVWPVATYVYGCEARTLKKHEEERIKQLKQVRYKDDKNSIDKTDDPCG